MKVNSINGYKCFETGLITHFGEELEVGKVYHIDGDIKFQNNGFHFCERLEDTLRYFDGMNDEIDICYVKGFGDIHEGNDEYYGYYNMYTANNIYLIKQLTKSDIFLYALNLSKYDTRRIKRFLQGYKLSSDELKIIERKYNSRDMLDYINYYQRGNKDVYIRERRI